MNLNICVHYTSSTSCTCRILGVKKRSKMKVDKFVNFPLSLAECSFHILTWNAASCTKNYGHLFSDTIHAYEVLVTRVTTTYCCIDKVYR